MTEHPESPELQTHMSNEIELRGTGGWTPALQFIDGTHEPVHTDIPDASRGSVQSRDGMLPSYEAELDRTDPGWRTNG